MLKTKRYLQPLPLAGVCSFGCVAFWCGNRKKPTAYVAHLVWFKPEYSRCTSVFIQHSSEKKGRSMPRNSFIVGSLMLMLLFSPLQSQAENASEHMLAFTPRPLVTNAAGSTTTTDGPHVLLQDVQLPAVLTFGTPFTIVSTWSNDGSPLASRWEIVYQLRKSNPPGVMEFISETDLSDALLPDAPSTSDAFWLDMQASAGVYALSVVVRDPENQRSPLPLAMPGVQPDGSYLLGDVTISAGDTASPDSATYRMYLPISIAGAIPMSTGTPNSTVNGKARGYLTTPQELYSLKQKAEQGREPYASNVRELLNSGSMSSPTSWSGSATISGSQYCSDGSQRTASGSIMSKGPTYITDNSRLLYAKTLAAHLNSGTRAESFAREARARILDLTDTTTWGGADYSSENQCVLYLSWYVPAFIMGADLLESFPEIWTTSDKRAFQTWLSKQVYPKVAWSSRMRTNNWGSSGSYAAAMIADYLWDSGLRLTEVSPQSRTLTPGEAYVEHTREQRSRMSTTIVARDERDSRCLPYKGIQPGGGIPDELRRASISDPTSMCRATYLPSSSGSYAAAYGYQMIHIEFLIAHAELALRRGDASLYTNRAPDGSGSILRAIKFIIQNPAKSSASYNWDINRMAQLYVAYRYYRDPAIRSHILQGDALRAGQIISYGRLTHGFADSDSPGLPPTVPPASN